MIFRNHIIQPDKTRVTTEYSLVELFFTVTYQPLVVLVILQVPRGQSWGEKSHGREALIQVTPMGHSVEVHTTLTTSSGTRKIIGTTVFFPCHSTSSVLLYLGNLQYCT